MNKEVYFIFGVCALIWAGVTFTTIFAIAQILQKTLGAAL